MARPNHAALREALDAVLSAVSSGSGRLITISGFDAAGKTTQVNAVATRLRERGRQVVVTREPTDWYRQQPEVREFLDHGAGADRKRMKILALLSAADRHRHVEDVVKPALASGADVVCDRYVHTTLALFLQRGMDLGFLVEINRDVPRPHASFYLDVPTPILMRRLQERDGDNLKYEERSRERIEGINRWHEAMREAFRVIDGTRASEEITDLMLETIDRTRTQSESALQVAAT